MYGPPGTGKTLIARALANNVDAKFLKVVASSIVDKYIGESARVIREMFSKCYMLIIKEIKSFYYQSSQLSRENMSLALFSWTKSMQSVDVVSPKVLQLIEKFKEH